jgi:hypothetical protein
MSLYLQLRRYFQAAREQSTGANLVLFKSGRLIVLPNYPDQQTQKKAAKDSSFDRS